MILGIYGAGGLGSEVLDLATIINKKDNCYEDIVFIDDNAAGRKERVLNGAGVLTFSEFSDKYSPDGTASPKICIGIGEPAIREMLANKVEAAGYVLDTLIHPSSQVGANTQIGAGCLIQYGCFISCDVKLGKNILIQPILTIGHDVRVGDNSVLSSFSATSGNVRIGQRTYIAVNVSIKEGASIGSDTIVGMGSVVARDIEDGVVALGNPARAMKKNDSKRVFG